MVEIELYDDEKVNLVRMFAGMSQKRDTYCIRAADKRMKSGLHESGDYIPGVAFFFEPAQERAEEVPARDHFMRWFDLDSIEKFGAALLVMAAQIREKEA